MAPARLSVSDFIKLPIGGWGCMGSLMERALAEWGDGKEKRKISVTNL
jgi:hypothetical protein